MKDFPKNENEKKYKYGIILTHLYFIYNYQIIFRKNCDKLILKNIL